jgi:hypothetical protein
MIPEFSEHPACPKHTDSMVPHAFEPLEDVALPRDVQVFRCPNLGCSFFYATGVLEGFYTRKSNGELVPYGSGQAAASTSSKRL